MGVMKMSAPATIVVGITDGLPAVVHQRAATIAKALGAHMVFVYVDQRSVNAARVMDPMGVAVLLDSDQHDADYVANVTETLSAQIKSALDDDAPEWTFELHEGLPAQTLAAAAKEHDALMIVVGTREPGIGGALREIVAGSVAAQLSHHQDTPVLVVPLNPQAWQKSLGKTNA